MYCTQLHRVRTPDDAEMRQTVRRCLAFFLHPDGDFVVRCLDGSDIYEPITDDQYYAKREGDTIYFKAAY